MPEFEVTATVPNTSLSVTTTAETLEQAQNAALIAIDAKIDNSIGGLSRGQGAYDYGKKLKDSVELNPPITPSAPTI